MIYVGIDVASDKHDYFMTHDSLTHYSKHSLTVPNNVLGYKKLHEDIRTFCGVMKDDRVRIGLESTGFFHKNILNYLVKLGYDVMLINPKLINLFKKSRKVHCPKNDNLDSRAISDYIALKDFKPYTTKSYHTEALKSLSRERFELVEDIRIVKQSIYRLVTITFPEYLNLFSNLYQGSSINILRAYPGSNKISKARLESISFLIHGRCMIDAYSIKELAKSSIGDKSEYLSFELKRLILKLDNLNSELESFDKEIKYYVDELNTEILSITGINYTTAGLILGEIGDISRFNSVDQLISYSGIDIEVYESGKYKATNKSISKKGSKYLRYALYQVSKVIWRFDPVFSKYYYKKQSEGKHYYVILGHIEKKVLRVIYSVLKNNKPYTPQV